jgi:hypothetical protein
MHLLKNRRVTAVFTAATLAVGALALAACAPAAAHCATTANGGDNDTQTSVTATGNRAPETYTLNHSSTPPGDHITRTQTGKYWGAPATSTDMFNGPYSDGLKVRGSGTFNCVVNGDFENVEAGPLHTTYTTWGGRNGVEVQQASFVIDHAKLYHNGFGVASTTNPNSSAQDGHDLRVRNSWFEWNYNGAYRNDGLADGVVLEGNLMRCLNSCIHSIAPSSLGVSHNTILDGNLLTVGAAGGLIYAQGPNEQCQGTPGVDFCDGADYQGWFENGTYGSTGVGYALWNNTFYANVYPKWGNLAPPTLTPYSDQTQVCHDNTIDVNYRGWSGADITKLLNDLTTWQSVCPTGLTIIADNADSSGAGNAATNDYQPKENTWITAHGTGF